MADDTAVHETVTSRRKFCNVVIYLIGIPAVGKYTIAKEIRRLTGAKVVDNQLINLPIFSVLGFDGKDTFPFPTEAWKHIERIREAVLTVIQDLCAPNDSFVFTNVLTPRAHIERKHVGKREAEQGRGEGDKEEDSRITGDVSDFLTGDGEGASE